MRAKRSSQGYTGGDCEEEALCGAAGHQPPSVQPSGFPNSHPNPPPWPSLPLTVLTWAEEPCFRDVPSFLAPMLTVTPGVAGLDTGALRAGWDGAWLLVNPSVLWTLGLITGLGCCPGASPAWHC